MRSVLLSRIWSSVPAAASPANSAALASANAPSVFDIEPMVSSPACPSRMGLARAWMARKQSDIPAVVTTGIQRRFRRSSPWPAPNPGPSLAQSRPTSRVVGIDHISIRVSDYQKSKALLWSAVRVPGLRDLGRVSQHDRLDERQNPLLDRAGRGPQELPHRRPRPAPLRLRAAQPPRRRRLAGLPRRPRRAHRRSGRRIL